MNKGLLTLSLMGMVCGTISLIVTRAKISKPVRDWLRKKADPPNSSPFWKFWHGLLTCAFCISLWISVGLWVMFRPGVFDSLLLDAVTGTFVTAFLASPVAWVIYTCHSAIAPPSSDQ